ncbi:sensor histidine kinase [Anaerotruncus colihominis]|uniref:GHKL domain-containing protein n=1 Tax=Anaerotruncus colihominis TaxID=169435 RepID=A0A845T1Y3_9FIRM|nr:sensor histidine kinase [Anaerotruncus colihominis]MCR2026455.1 GHKL domain-containing protein [Anaerotruncus colihominis]NDO40763.1 GHKL domain-containing protein [Anaerotruncus colihominis]
MSETGFRIFNSAFSAGAELTYAVLLTAFFKPFIPSQGRKRRKLLIVFSIYILFEIVCNRAALPQGSFGLILAVMLLAASKWIGLEKSFVFLLTLLYFNARISSGLMVQSLYFIVERSLPFQLEPPDAVFLRAAFLVMLFLVSHAALLAVMLYALQRQMRKQRMTLHRRELCYLSLVPTAGILFGQVISRLLIEFEDGVLLQLYERHPAFLAVIPVLALLFYAGAYLTIAFQQGMAALREEQATYFMEQQQTQAIRARIHEAEQFYTRIRQLKHEMRGHLTNIKGLAGRGEYASLEDYIAKLDESMSGFELTLLTGNPVTDVIVNDTRRRSLDLGIRFQVDFHYPEPGAYDAFDVGIILQNLLQNALEACEKVSEGERFIVLTGKRKGRFFLIEVKNSFVGEVIFGQDGLPVTTKQEDAPMHGIGLSNVRREAEKYMGELELRTDQREFSATVLLQERGN